MMVNKFSDLFEGGQEAEETIPLVSDNCQKTNDFDHINKTEYLKQRKRSSGMQLKVQIPTLLLTIIPLSIILWIRFDANSIFMTRDVSKAPQQIEQNATFRSGLIIGTSSNLFKNTTDNENHNSSKVVLILDYKPKNENSKTQPEKQKSANVTKNKNGIKNNATLTKTERIETVNVAFNDLKYRKVCSSVGLASIICMYVRFPFPVPLQINDPTIRFPYPVDDRFYELDKRNVHSIDQSEWFICNNDVMDVVDYNIIKLCLDIISGNITKTRHDNKEPVVSLWTRERFVGSDDSSLIFHGIGHDTAIHNIYRFFGTNHQILVVGASPSPRVTENLHWLLGTKCTYTGVHRWPNYNCENPLMTTTTAATPIDTSSRIEETRDHHHSNLRSLETITNTSYKPFFTLQEPYVNFGVFDYRLISGDSKHVMPNTTVLEAMNIVNRTAGWKELRNFSLMVEYPFAHIQSQRMIRDEMDIIRSHQTILPTRFMDFTSKVGVDVLATRGYQFRHMIVFDGLPQYYPTETNGWTIEMYTFKNNNYTYNGWRPEYGTSCRGPLPQNSILREINLLSRKRFVELGHNVQWYGQTWEFANLFWWQDKMWNYTRDGKPGISCDCTHPDGYDGSEGVHKYFVQAMIDDYYENMD